MPSSHVYDVTTGVQREVHGVQQGGADAGHAEQGLRILVGVRHHNAQHRPPLPKHEKREAHDGRGLHQKSQRFEIVVVFCFEGIIAIV